MKRRMLTFLVALVGLYASAASAQGTPTGFLDRVATQKGQSYRYQVYVPVDYDASRPYPVVLFLHGAGERGADGLLQTHVGIGAAIRQNRERFPFLVVFPQARPNGLWVGDIADQALKALDQTIEEFNVDRRRVYLTGLSLGGHGTWYVAARATGRFAAIVPVCGFVALPRSDMPAENKARLLAENPFAALSDPYQAVASQIRNVPVWIFHGGADTVVSVEESRRMVQALKALGADVKYTEYEGVGHNSWDKAYAEPELISWLLSKRRDNP